MITLTCGCTIKAFSICGHQSYFLKQQITLTVTNAVLNYISLTKKLISEKKCHELQICNSSRYKWIGPTIDELQRFQNKRERKLSKIRLNIMELILNLRLNVFWQQIEYWATNNYVSISIIKMPSLYKIFCWKLNVH